ncbi:MAG: hemolysin family protein [Candidatus Marinimicrobia bacterium]|nr:hemolysin family protein [Candidatus Neomarinimicrobiota bacterium]MCF7851130.1 hemolysin family protein [Candidatus Neomarinimicrobiota bacterium]MCF7904047.1 hemolysin family protein [Candidatus Neomarinimicrobiota bacterium]
MIELILAIIGLVLSFLFAGAEIALLSSNRLQLEVWQRRAVRGSKAALRANQDPEQFLTATLVGNNIANILTTSFATVMLIQVISNEIWVLLIISTSVLIFGEIIPKSLFREFPNASMLFFGRFIRVAEILFFPLTLILNFYRKYVLHSGEVESQTNLDTEELHLLFNEPNEDSGVDVHERQTIARIFTFKDTSISEVMTPRPDVTAVSLDSTIEEVEAAFLESGFSKLPVYQETIDDIKGIVFLHDIFRGADALSEVLREAYFVPETKSTDELLQEMKIKSLSIAIVIDEYGGTAGLVTIEDISEELFGEFTDAFDEEDSPVQGLENGWLVKGNAEIDHLNDDFAFAIPEGDYETLAGFLIDNMGRIPQKNEQYLTETHRFVISTATATRVETIFIQER